MAREYARIRISIAGDDDVEALSLEAQWLYFRILIPEAKLSHCGVADWRPRRLLGKARQLTLATILHAAAELEAARFALFDEDTEEVLVRSYVRSEELFRNPKMAVAVADAFLGVASRPLRAAIATEVQRDRADHPEYSSWSHAISRDAVGRLLSAPTADQVGYAIQYPVTNGNANGYHEEVRNGIEESVHNGIAKPDPDPGADWVCDLGPDSLHLAPTSLQPAPMGGRERTEPQEATAPDADPPPPSRFCSKHPDGTDQPCVACRAARQAHDRWQIAHADTAAADLVATQRQAREDAAQALAWAIVACDRCDDDGYLGGQVCDHRDHATAETRAAAKAAVAAALGKGGDA